MLTIAIHSDSFECKNSHIYIYMVQRKMMGNYIYSILYNITYFIKHIHNNIHIVYIYIFNKYIVHTITYNI